MSPRLPRISGQQAIRAFARVGYEVIRQRGSHIRLRHPTDPSRLPVTIPNHRELKQGLLRRLIADARLTVGEFSQLLDG